MTCPGFLLQRTSRDKLRCQNNIDQTTVLQFSAIIMNASTYDIHGDIQDKLRKYVWQSNPFINPVYDTFDNVPSHIVYLDVLDGNHLTDHPRINAYLMQLIIFCNITRYHIQLEDAHLLENLTSVKYLDLSHNWLQNNISFILLRITSLIFLDVSSNLISHISRSFLCMSPHIKYLFLHNNALTSLDPKVFHPLTQLRVVFLQNNQLSTILMAATLLFPMGSSLSMLWSDIPRLCCLVTADRECKPPFQLFALTCENMIHSVLHVSVSWTVGVLTSSCNFAAVLIFLVIFIKPNMLSIKQRLSAYLSLNIILSDFVVSLCLLSLCFHNISYHDVFGIYADQWKRSFHCIILELLMFVCTECSLLFSVYLVFHLYIRITSMAPSHGRHSRSLVVIAAIWTAVILLGVCKIVVWKIFIGDEYNYYCLSFQVSKPKHLIVKVFLTCIIIINTSLIAIYIAFQLILFKFIRDHIKQTSQCFKTKIHGWKIALKLSFMIVSNVVTWTPILVAQLFIMLGPDINPSTLYLILLVSIPSNLLIIPLVMVIPFLRSATVTKSRPVYPRESKEKLELCPYPLIRELREPTKPVVLIL